MSALQKYSLLTRTPALVEAPLRQVVKAAKKVLEEMNRRAERFFLFANAPVKPGSASFKECLCGESLEEALNHLDPVTDAGPTFHLFLETESEWTVYFCNSSLGQGYLALVKALSKILEARAIHALSTLADDPMPAQMLYVYNKGEEVRALECLKEDRGWEFNQRGRPLKFEELKKYKARRKPDRFTSEMLRKYLRELGARPFAEDFYNVTRSHPAYGIERVDRDKQTRDRFTRIPLKDVKH